jgi:hypothetical protein
VRARRERLQHKFLELEESLLPRAHEPEVQQALDDARRSLEALDEAITRLEFLANT